MSASEHGRYLNALRYYAPIILALAALVAAAAYGVFNAKEEDFEATVRIAKQDVGGSEAASGEQSRAREMQTIAELVTTRPVMTAAADQIEDESEETLRRRVRASVEPGTNILRIVVKDDDPEEASISAGVVSGTFRAVRAGVARGHLASVREELTRRINRAGSPELEATLRARQREVEASEALAGSDLFVVEAPVPPRTRASSTALPEAAIAFGATLLLGIAAALLHELMVPHIATTRELSRLLDLRVLGEVPRNRKRLGRHTPQGTTSEDAAYHLARALLQQDLSDEEPQILVVTSGLKGEGKTTVTASLGRALADGGSQVLLVGGDTRNEDLISAFGVESRGTFTELTETTARNTEDLVVEVETDDSRGGQLAVLPAGTPPGRPEAISEAEVEAAFTRLRTMPYEIILVDSAPLLSAADARLLARAADHAIVVARLARLTRKDALDLRDVLRSLGLTHAYLLVMGRRAARSRVLMPSPQKARALETG